MIIRTRFAPSPTGEPHIGNIRTALFAWLYAKSHGGDFILRIEDTDKSRCMKGAIEAILESLEWLGLDYDNKNEIIKLLNCQIAIPKNKLKSNKAIKPANSAGGQFNNFKDIYLQSQRLPIYQYYAKELVKKGYAYYCSCSTERLKILREEQQKKHQPPMYDGHCRHTNYEFKNNKLNQNYVIRLKVPLEGITEFNDMIRGQVKFENKLIDDQVLLKSDGFPTYHLANVVDDYLMGITHVVRAEEWLSSTPKHILLYQYFGWSMPQFAHLPMILGPDKTKLSKRHGATSILEYKRKGYLAEAMINYLALLGWNPGTDEEIFSLSFSTSKNVDDNNYCRLIQEFSLERVQKSPAIFNQEKLDWLNGVYIRKMGDDELVDRIWRFLKERGSIVSLFHCFIVDNSNNFKQGLFRRAVLMIKDRLKKFNEFMKLAGFIFEKNLKYNTKLLVFVKSDKKITIKSLELAFNVLNKLNNSDFNQQKLKSVFNKLMQKHHLSGGDILHPLRISLSGLKDSPSPFEIAEVLGKQESLRRIKLALEKLKK